MIILGQSAGRHAGLFFILPTKLLFSLLFSRFLFSFLFSLFYCPIK